MDEWDFPGKIHSRLSQIDGLCSVYMSQRVRENLKFSSGERGLSAAVDGFPLPQPSAASGVKGRGGKRSGWVRAARAAFTLSEMQRFFAEITLSGNTGVLRFAQNDRRWGQSDKEKGSE